MIDVGMYVALGFLIASLLALMLVPLFWNRAVRLTKRRIEATMPMSAADIQADKDQLRAEFAIELRRVEVALEKAKDKAARELVEANKRRVEISEIKSEFETVKGSLQEKENANRVLEQTIRRRLPELENRLRAAKDAMAELESANAELRTTVASQAEALKVARSTLSTQRGDIDQLRGALDVGATPSRRSAKSDASLAKENRRLTAELSKLKQELVQGKTGGKEDELLRRELGKLARQVLAVAKGQDVALADLAAAKTGSALSEADVVLIGRNGGDSGAEVTPVLEARVTEETEPPLASTPPPEDAAPVEVEQESEGQGSLAKILAARKARRRGSRGRGQSGSLSERLKNVGAEASDS